MKKIVLLVLLLLGIAILFLSFRSGGTKEIPVHVKSVTKISPTTAKQSNALPVRLRIPSLNISASIEHVGMDEKGNMDVPKKDENVAWYELGYLPGVNGNAVIAGHLDTVTGAPAVFYHLENINVGDEILVEMGDQSKLTFTVTKKAVYPNDTFPLVEVFGPSDIPRLNLITCEGTYTKEAHGYSHRTVIFSKLAEK